MVKSEKSPFGYIYRANHIQNEKNYLGKTGKTIEKRWSKYLEKAEALRRAREANPNKKISGTHFDNALAKYGPDAFTVKQEDVAFSKAELNEKERYYIKEYDSMNPDKGYNMTEGGEGGKPSPEVIEKLREIAREKANDPEWLNNVSKGVSNKYQTDPEYAKKQTDERRERAKNSEWVKKMTKINREKGKEPKFRGKVSNVIKAKYDKDPEYAKKQTNERRERAKNPEWVKKMTDINRARAKDPKWLEKMRGINSKYRKEITDKHQFFKDIQNMQKKDVAEKYNMDGKTVNRRIEEMLGEHGVKNYSQAKEYLKDKNLDNVLKDIETGGAEKQDENQTSDSKSKGSEKVQREDSEEEGKENKSPEENRKESSEEKREEQSKEEPHDQPKEEPHDKPKEEPQDQPKKNISEKPNDDPSESKANKSPEEVDKGEKFEYSRFPPHSQNEKKPDKEFTLCEGLGPVEPPRKDDKNVPKLDNKPVDSPKENRKIEPLVEDGPIKEEKQHPHWIDTSNSHGEEPLGAQSKDYDGIDEFSGEETIDYLGIDDDLREEDGLNEESNDFEEDIFTEDYDGDENFRDDGWVDGESEEMGRDYDGIDDAQSEDYEEYEQAEEASRGGEDARGG